MVKSMKVTVKQELNEKGVIGAVLFVGSPILASYLWQSSTSEYFESMRLFGTSAYSAADKIYPYGMYIALSGACLIGFVMLLVGRDYSMTMPRSEPSDDGSNA
jgi:hypothetical protein